jgi:hypothetical protein
MEHRISENAVMKSMDAKDKEATLPFSRQL